VPLHESRKAALAPGSWPLEVLPADPGHRMESPPRRYGRRRYSMHQHAQRPHDGEGDKATLEKIYPDTPGSQGRHVSNVNYGSGFRVSYVFVSAWAESSSCRARPARSEARAPSALAGATRDRRPRSAPHNGIETCGWFGL
jgi:hypothetical protein